MRKASSASFDVKRAGIGIGIDRDRADAEPPGRADDAAGDFTAIGNEDLRKHALWPGLLRRDDFDLEKPGPSKMPAITTVIAGARLPRYSLRISRLADGVMPVGEDRSSP